MNVQWACVECGDPLGTDRLHVGHGQFAEGVTAWYEPSDLRQDMHRVLERESQCWWVSRRPLDTDFHVKKAMERVSLGQDCKVAEVPCSGPVTKDTGCPHTHPASFQVVARNCRRASSFCNVHPVSILTLKERDM